MVSVPHSKPRALIELSDAVILPFRVADVVVTDVAEFVTTVAGAALAVRLFLLNDRLMPPVRIATTTKRSPVTTRTLVYLSISVFVLVSIFVLSA